MARRLLFKARLAEQNKTHPGYAAKFRRLSKLMLAAAGGEEGMIATGYALDEDGLWRQHSWVVDSKRRVIETSETQGVLRHRVRRDRLWAPS